MNRPTAAETSPRSAAAISADRLDSTDNTPVGRYQGPEWTCPIVKAVVKGPLISLQTGSGCLLPSPLVGLCLPTSTSWKVTQQIVGRQRCASRGAPRLSANLLVSVKS